VGLWQSPVWIHPDTAAAGAQAGRLVRIRSRWGSLEAPVYVTDVIRPGVLAMETGQGHSAYGRYAENVGANPFAILPATATPCAEGLPVAWPRSRWKPRPQHHARPHRWSRIQHGRAFLLTTTLTDLRKRGSPAKTGLTMDHFPLTLPMPEGYDPKRDFYPAHDHDHYRWAMVVDLDRCIGCGACVAACYAENNVGIVGEKLITQGREMAWLEIVQRYHDERRMQRLMFLPMLCQH